jgi:hypothetical protein
MRPGQLVLDLDAALGPSPTEITPSAPVRDAASHVPGGGAAGVLKALISLGLNEAAVPVAAALCVALDEPPRPGGMSQGRRGADEP